MERVIEIPREFRCLPFFKESVNSIAYYAEQSFEETIQKTYFIYDIEKQYEPWNDIEKQYEPWNEIENSIPVMLNVWKNKHEDIATLFRNRKKQEAEGPMILFAAHLLSIVYWLNEQPVHSLNKIEDFTSELEVQPVNFIERYSFIIKKPNNYHSYIQLAQLYIEIEKLYVKKMITKKKSCSR
ncbi:YpoC family protein [Bacillus cereus]|uniref:YpoC family protein n=1 Tax=Bacillus TaxID=1386 RepID=UPI0005A30278|nr:MULTISPECIES: hypothetical protein [Bacillus cereus group]AJG57533.1 hypothetical protein AW22_3125 [Bacillus cereus D17]MCC2343022.1 GTPase [Bacillus anthracis]MCU5054395.1 GTPase [Bacillus cereus]QKI10806.1 GTPase [Bacillus cereus]USL03976.1 GTPase [Bacillus anthracis]